ncbi:mechanosensitive ion channel family protein [Shewanella sp. JM162201]|uniref:Small-conductance mechanosensitive channel n=1 Tax=Shewanella jiangmenensis TaxID=2837387 RepID=A0ABS5V120_9GAMM|nr:mechanosensitive ion channel family protein [Shewanella jiangmenensis]MBT1444171.1 mechanosensitive ion channel family protein [Shewanella jiangmenensis]
MHRLLATLLLGIGLLTSSATFAVSDEFRAKVTQLEQSVVQDLELLEQAKGEMVTITEYRLGHKTEELRNLIAPELDKPDADKAYLLTLIEHQLGYVLKTQQYLASDIKRLQKALGTDKDAPTLLALSSRERERDMSYKTELLLLDWSAKLGVDVSARRAELQALLIDRADRLASLVDYTQTQLQLAVDESRDAGKDVTAEQTARVTELKSRLDQNSASLSTAIGLLDQLGGDTTAFKETLFTVSGDITQDVLDIDVVTSLLRQWLGAAEAQAVENGPKVAFKLFIFCLILFLAGLVSKVVKRLVKTAVSNSKLKFSKLLQDFFVSLSAKGVYTLGVLIALSQLGFELGPLLAGFGIAGVIIGFALQDSLSNFASGMMILVYRPYDVGDLISAAGVTGRVSHMSLVSTTIKTLDNQRLIIPNNKIWGDTINNITAERHRRVDMTFGISYSDNVDKAEDILTEIVKAHPKVLKDPDFTVKLHLLGESSVDFIVRPWVRPDDYWEVYWDITKSVKLRFDEEGITIPFPQRDVHFYRG